MYLKLYLFLWSTCLFAWKHLRERLKSRTSLFLNLWKMEPRSLSCSTVTTRMTNKMHNWLSSGSSTTTPFQSTNGFQSIIGGLLPLNLSRESTWTIPSRMEPDWQDTVPSGWFDRQLNSLEDIPVKFPPSSLRTLNIRLCLFMLCLLSCRLLY